MRFSGSPHRAREDRAFSGPARRGHAHDLFPCPPRPRRPTTRGQPVCRPRRAAARAFPRAPRGRALRGRRAGAWRTAAAAPRAVGWQTWYIERPLPSSQTSQCFSQQVTERAACIRFDQLCRMAGGSHIFLAGSHAADALGLCTVLLEPQRHKALVGRCDAASICTATG